MMVCYWHNGNSRINKINKKFLFKYRLRRDFENVLKSAKSLIIGIEIEIKCSCQQEQIIRKKST